MEKDLLKLLQKEHMRRGLVILAALLSGHLSLSFLSDTECRHQ
jgi:hypothetical protein